MLQQLESLSTRFIFFPVFLSFGGLCVAMQTVAVTAASGLKTGSYLPAKITQAAISLICSYFTSVILFPGEKKPSGLLIFFSILIVTAYGIYAGNSGKKPLENLRRIVYNDPTLHTR